MGVSLVSVWHHVSGPKGSALGAVFDHSPMAPPIVYPVKVCLATGFSSGSRHLVKGEFRV